MSRLPRVEDYAREHLDVAVPDVMSLVGCSRRKAERILLLLVELRRMHKVSRGLFAIGDHEGGRG